MTDETLNPSAPVEGGKQPAVPANDKAPASDAPAGDAPAA